MIHLVIISTAIQPIWKTKSFYITVTFSSYCAVCKKSTSVLRAHPQLNQRFIVGCSGCHNHCVVGVVKDILYESFAKGDYDEDDEKGGSYYSKEELIMWKQIFDTEDFDLYMKWVSRDYLTGEKVDDIV